MVADLFEAGPRLNEWVIMEFLYHGPRRNGGKANAAAGMTDGVHHSSMGHDKNGWVAGPQSLCVVEVTHDGFVRKAKRAHARENEWDCWWKVGKRAPFPDGKYRNIYTILNVCTVSNKIERNGAKKGVSCTKMKRTKMSRVSSISSLHTWSFCKYASTL